MIFGAGGLSCALTANDEASTRGLSKKVRFVALQLLESTRFAEQHARPRKHDLGSAYQKQAYALKPLEQQFASSSTSNSFPAGNNTRWSQVASN
jgi:hypothetical protein